MQKRALSAEDVPKLILLVAVILGGWFRFMPAWLAGFPVNDGGMFYVMVKELQAERFIPPLYTSYNQLNIPFAYPPLAFYFGALLSRAFHVSELDILRWLPPLVNTLTIPAFYLLAREIVEDKLKSAVAALVFAFTPHMLEWLSMGGGLTRSFGALFMMLTALYSHRLFARGENRHILPTILFGSLTALSHTESTVYAIVIPITFWAFASRSLRGIRQGLGVAAGVLPIAGAWYGFIVFKHGFDPLLSALETGAHDPLALIRLFNMSKITVEPMISLLGAAGLLGAALLAARKQYLIPALVVVIYFTQPRSAHTVVNIPLALAAGTFIVDSVLIPFKGKSLYLIAFTSPFLLLNIVYQGYLVSLNHVSEEERESFDWVAANTPEQSRFLVLTGEADPMCDSASEWFPALANRRSITTVQGREWVSGGEIENFIIHRISLEACLDDTAGCLERESEFFGEMDYLYISPGLYVTHCNRPVDFAPAARLLILSLESAEGYEKQYDANGVVIFKRLP